MNGTRRFTFPAVNLATPVEPQMANRAAWVGYELTKLRNTDNGQAAGWRLSPIGGGASFKCASLVEVDLRLEQILEGIGERIELEWRQRLSASRTVEREAATAMGLAS